MLAGKVDTGLNVANTGSVDDERWAAFGVAAFAAGRADAVDAGAVGIDWDAAV
jgi:hypothetical protein